jgi:hypothetical protein
MCYKYMCQILCEILFMNILVEYPAASRNVSFYISLDDILLIGGVKNILRNNIYVHVCTYLCVTNMCQILCEILFMNILIEYGMYGVIN